MRHAAITAAIATVLVPALSACAGSSETESADEYPLVEQERPEVRETVTTEGGGSVSLLELPTITEAEPSPTCERMAVAGGGTIVVPPAPGLKATAVSKRTIRLEWSFEQLPEDCRPVMLLLAVNADSSPRATPTVEEVQVDGASSGSFELTYPDFLAPPDVARAAVYSEQGMRSRITRVLIVRGS